MVPGSSPLLLKNYMIETRRLTIVAGDAKNKAGPPKSWSLDASEIRRVEASQSSRSSRSWTRPGIAYGKAIMEVH